MQACVQCECMGGGGEAKGEIRRLENTEFLQHTSDRAEKSIKLKTEHTL